MTESEIRAAIREWVAQTCGAEPGHINDQSELFGGGLLKSVHLLDLILLIEEMAEADIDVEKLGPASFKDIDTVIASFFAPVRDRGAA